jgi:hypothetical protein
VRSTGKVQPHRLALGRSDPALFERYATELVALRPDLLLANGTPSVAASKPMRLFAASIAKLVYGATTLRGT